LESKQWQAHWICDPRFAELEPINVFKKELDPPDPALQAAHPKNQHMYVRRSFHLDSAAREGLLDITADDYYKLYINGHYVGQGPAPSYPFHYAVNRYSVSDWLRPGENVIAVHVYYQGLINRVWNSGDGRQGLIAELFLDGQWFVGTDAHWKYWPAQEYTGETTIGYDTQFPENIDSRLHPLGWRRPGFDDSAWRCPEEKHSHDYQFYYQATPPVQVYSLRPRKVRAVSLGRYFVDMGHEITGSLRMKAKGKPGQKVENRCGEELEEGSAASVRYRMRCGCTYQEQWTLSGEEDTLEHFDYKAFRYAEIIDPNGAVDIDSVQAEVRHYPFDEGAAHLRSSDPRLDAIWGICSRGVQYGCQEGFLDCPSREKGQYLGDLTITAQAQVYLTGDLRLFRKSIEDFARTAFVCPGLLAVAPGSYMQEVADFSLQWPLQLLLYYKHSGDKEFLRDMLPVVEGLETYFRRYERDDGLLERVWDKWNLVDWPQNLRDNYDFPLEKPIGPGVHNVINAFYCGMLQAAHQIRGILGLDSDRRYARVEESYHRAFYRSERGVFADSETSSHASLHSNALALYFGLVPEDAVGSVVNLLEQKGLACGVYMSFFVLKALSKAGRRDLMYRLLTNDSEHSWNNMLREGATTCFEAWGKEQKWNTSLCHPWASAPIIVMIEDVLGLEPAVPGWGEIKIAPHVPPSLNDLQLQIPLPAGRAHVTVDAEHAVLHAVLHGRSFSVSAPRSPAG